jgi:hypothetical protein
MCARAVRAADQAAATIHHAVILEMTANSVRAEAAEGVAPQRTVCAFDRSPADS